MFFDFCEKIHIYGVEKRTAGATSAFAAGYVTQVVICVIFFFANRRGTSYV